LDQIGVLQDQQVSIKNGTFIGTNGLFHPPCQYGNFTSGIFERRL
jgi:hypothetical protein